MRERSYHGATSRPVTKKAHISQCAINNTGRQTVTQSEELLPEMTLQKEGLYDN